MHRKSGGETFIEALVPERLGRNAQLEQALWDRISFRRFVG